MDILYILTHFFSLFSYSLLDFPKNIYWGSRKEKPAQYWNFLFCSLIKSISLIDWLNVEDVCTWNYVYVLKHGILNQFHVPASSSSNNYTNFVFMKTSHREVSLSSRKLDWLPRLQSAREISHVLWQFQVGSGGGSRCTPNVL